MYQIDDKVRIRSLKDMRCEFETPSPQYCGNALIFGYIHFIKSMIPYCGKEFFIKDFYFCNHNIYRLETNCGRELPFAFAEYMFERCGKTLENILKKIWKSWIIKYSFDRRWYCFDTGG